MLIVKINQNRTWFIDEYWVLIPLAVYLEYLIIKRINKIDPAQVENVLQKITKRKLFKAENKKELLEVTAKTSNHNSKYLAKKSKYLEKARIRKIFHFSMGNLIAVLQIRGGEELIRIGGEDLINLVDSTCIVGQGARHVDHSKIRNLLHQIYPHKVRNGVLYITEMALCYFVRRNAFAIVTKAFPLPFENAIVVSNIFQLVIKVGATGIVGFAFLSQYIYYQFREQFRRYLPQYILRGWIAFNVMAALFGILGIVVSVFGFFIIPTTLIAITDRPIKARIKGIAEVVSIKFQPQSQPKVQLLPNKPLEFIFTESWFFNGKERLSAREIIDISQNLGLTYNDVVNMQDMTSFYKLQFADKYQLPSSSEISHVTKKVLKKAKMVRFLKKFGDPANIAENQTWYTDENAIDQMVNVVLDNLLE